MKRHLKFIFMVLLTQLGTYALFLLSILLSDPNPSRGRATDSLRASKTSKIALAFRMSKFNIHKDPIKPACHAQLIQPQDISAILPDYSRNRRVCVLSKAASANFDIYEAFDI